MKKHLIALLMSVFTLGLFAQDIPQHISYTRIYDFLDELANDGIIELNSTIKPYSRKLIADKLQDAKLREGELNNRQKKDLKFFMREYALEYGKLPDAFMNVFELGDAKLDLIQPAFYYLDASFKARITPLIGMHIWNNGDDNVVKRWVGAELQTTIGKNLTIYGSLRDNSFTGGLLAKPGYLNDFPGGEYKESSTGAGDFSDSRGGIKYAWNWGSVGLIKDNVVWGDNYHGSNILSGRAPSFPMLTLRVKPAKWFELNYFHGWLVSNVTDSTNYYLDNQDQKQYRMANKFIAANMFTFTPVRNLNISVGNSIIYAEQNIQPAYLIPVAFYKSMDHSLTKGLGMENQNSQVFMNISSRNIKHVHLFASLYADEVSFSRFKPSNKQANPVSYKIGAHISNFPVRNLSLMTEFTRSNIINYKHSIPALTWASNSYNLGHYLGDNSQEFYVALRYKPVRGLDITLSFTDAKHGNEYDYIRRIDGQSGSVINQIISQPVLKDIIWQNQTFGLKATYEVFNNAYAVVDIQQSNTKTSEPASPAVTGEVRLTAQEYMDLFTPKFLQGNKTVIMVGFGFGF